MVAIVAWVLIVIVSYLLGVFFVPDTTRSFESMIGLSGTTDTISWLKAKLDDTSVWIDEVQSWALEVGSWVIETLDTTKSKIDTIRWAAEWIKETAQEQMERTKQVVDEFANSEDWLIKIGDGITNSVNTWATQ